MMMMNHHHVVAVVVVMSAGCVFVFIVGGHLLFVIGRIFLFLFLLMIPIASSRHHHRVVFVCSFCSFRSRFDVASSSSNEIHYERLVRTSSYSLTISSADRKYNSDPFVRFSLLCNVQMYMYRETSLFLASTSTMPMFYGMLMYARSINQAGGVSVVDDSSRSDVL